MSRIAKLGAVLAVAALGVLIGILVERGASSEADTAESRYLIPANESPDPETAEIIEQFSLLEKPTPENLSALSEDDRHWIRDGLFHSGEEHPEVTAVGRVDTGLAEVVVFTTNQNMCINSSAARRDQLIGSCLRLRRALRGWVSNFRQYDFRRRGYVAAVLPDRVESVEPSKPVGKLNLEDNVADGLTRVRDFVIRGLDGDRVVTRTNVPLRTFWSSVRYP